MPWRTEPLDHDVDVVRRQRNFLILANTHGELPTGTRLSKEPPFCYGFWHRDESWDDWSTTTAFTQEPQRAGFLDLPGELRNKIYDLNLKDLNVGKELLILTASKHFTPPMTRVNRQIRQEYISLLYSRMTVIINLQYQSQITSAWLQMLAPESLKHIRQIRFDSLPFDSIVYKRSVRKKFNSKVFRHYNNQISVIVSLDSGDKKPVIWCDGGHERARRMWQAREAGSKLKLLLKRNEGGVDKALLREMIAVLEESDRLPMFCKVIIWAALVVMVALVMGGASELIKALAMLEIEGI